MPKVPLTYRIIGFVASLAMVAIAIWGKMPTYRLAPAILIPVLWGLYALRRLINLRRLGYALLASALMLHMSGAFGFYQRSPFPCSFDIVVHYYFAMVVTLALYRALQTNFPLLRGQHLVVITFFFLMGLAALHEIMEYCSYLLLGEERGMLKPSTSYYFDTQRDLTNNLLGTITGLLISTLNRKNRRPI